MKAERVLLGALFGCDLHRRPCHRGSSGRGREQAGTNPCIGAVLGGQRSPILCNCGAVRIVSAWCGPPPVRLAVAWDAGFARYYGQTAAATYLPRWCPRRHLLTLRLGRLCLLSPPRRPSQESAWLVSQPHILSLLRPQPCPAPTFPLGL